MKRSDKESKITIFFKMIILEIMYHRRTLKYLPFKRKFHYIYHQVILRDCYSGNNCFGDGSIKYLDTRHKDEIANIEFICDGCYQTAQKNIMNKWKDIENQQQDVVILPLKKEQEDENIVEISKISKSTEETVKVPQRKRQKKVKGE